MYLSSVLCPNLAVELGQKIGPTRISSGRFLLYFVLGVDGG